MKSTQKHLNFDIDRFIGKWETKDKICIEIKKVDELTALASFFSKEGKAIIRPYCNNQPAQNLPAKYYEYTGEMRINLCENSETLELELHHHKKYELDELNRESLVPSLISDIETNNSSQISKLFGNLAHFVKF